MSNKHRLPGHETGTFARVVVKAAASKPSKTITTVSRALGYSGSIERVFLAVMWASILLMLGSWR